MISKNEYIKAKKIIDEYEYYNHHLNVEARFKLGLHKTPKELYFDDFYNTLDNISVRLRAAINTDFFNTKLIDIKKKDFLAIKGNGLKTWTEFCDLTGKDFFDKN